MPLQVPLCYFHLPLSETNQWATTKYVSIWITRKIPYNTNNYYVWSWWTCTCIALNKSKQHILHFSIFYNQLLKKTVEKLTLIFRVSTKFNMKVNWWQKTHIYNLKMINLTQTLTYIVYLGLWDKILNPSQFKVC